MTSALEAAKRSLRATIAKRIPAPGSPAHAEASAGAQHRLLSSPLAASARCIALYRATPGECSTSTLVEQLRSAGKDLCFPSVAPGDPVLRFLRAHGPARRSALGIEEHEDVAAARVPFEEIELFVVPARAVDAAGHRLGRGKGYYDATLTAAPHARRVCLVFDAQVVDAVPHAAHDEQMDAICTDARWLDCPRLPR